MGYKRGYVCIALLHHFRWPTHRFLASVLLFSPTRLYRKLLLIARNEFLHKLRFCPAFLTPSVEARSDGKCRRRLSISGILRFARVNNAWSSTRYRAGAQLPQQQERLGLFQCGRRRWAPRVRRLPVRSLLRMGWKPWICNIVSFFCFVVLASLLFVTHGCTRD